MKICKTCGRKAHSGICDMAELTDGRTVHVSRIDKGGDLHDLLGKDFKVKNRWIKTNRTQNDQRSSTISTQNDL